MSDSTSHPVQTLWQRIVGWLIKSHPMKPAQARQAKLAAVILLAGEALTLVALVTGFILRANSSDPTLLGDYLLRGGILAALLLVLFVINRRGLTTLAGIGLSVFLLILAFSLLIASGPLTPNAVALVVPVIVAGLFGPPISAIVMALLAGLAYLFLNIHARPDYLASFFKDGEVLQTTLVYFNLAIVALMSWLFSRMARQALEESQELSLALVTQRIELEERIAMQTRQFQATTTVARAIAGTRDLDQLLQNIVRLIRETFGYHHVQVFLVDETTEYAILRQSTGEVGSALQEQDHRLPVGSMSVIGQVTASGRPVIASDTDADFTHRGGELPPGTRSEIALPLAIGERVIGALDMQSVEPNAFDENMLPTFQALADQLAVAIENARLFEQAQANLREFRELSRDVTQHSWAEFLAESREEERHQIHGPEPKALEIHRSRVIERVLGSGTIVVSTGKDGRQAFLAAPIVVRNEVIGVLGIEPDSVREWTQEDLHLLQRIAERTALAVENARLYLQTQRAAEREHLISDIAAQLQRAPSLAILLESAAKELSRALGTDNVYAEISLENPLAHSRQQVSGTDEEAGDEGQTGATAAEDTPAPDEPEEARAEL